MYCSDILRRRKVEKRKRNSELRHQLEAILGDTRGDQIGFGSEVDAQEESEEDDSDDAQEDTDSDSDSDDSDEDEEDSSDDDRPIFGHYVD
jgi:hypothetical protein